MKAIHSWGILWCALALGAGSLGRAQAPANNLFANRVVLSGTAVSISGTSDHATREVGEPTILGRTPNATVWWTWTAPATGTVSIQVVGSSFAFSTAVCTGATLSELRRVGEAAGTVLFHADEGVSYQIVVASEWSIPGAGSFTLTLALQSAPANDMFKDAALISGALATVTGTNVGASPEPGEFADGFVRPARSVWWKWTAPTDGRVTIDTSGTQFPRTLSVYRGTELGQLQLLGSGSTAGVVEFSAVAGSEYRIKVDSSIITITGTISLNLRLTDPPANDLFGQATSIAGESVTATGSNLGATAEPGEPMHGITAAARSVWWRWIAPRSGTVLLSTTGSGITTYPAVYTGATLDALTRVDQGVQAIPNDNYFHADAGVTYHIAIDTRDRGASLSLRLDLVDGPANDQFVDRIPITGPAITVTGTTYRATNEPGEPYSWISRDSVWWEWTAPATGRVLLTAETPAFTSVLSAYTGNAIESLTLVARREGEYLRANSLVFEAVEGTAYPLSLSSRGGTGSFTMTLELREGPPNDDFADRIPIPGSGGIITGSNAAATAEPGEPIHGLGARRATVWWTWTAPEDCRAIISNSGSAIATILGVYSGTSLETLVPVALVVGHNPADLSSLFVFHALAGHSYEIVVESATSEVGAIQLELRSVQPPVNDLFADRTILTGESAEGSTRTDGALGEPNEPLHSELQSPLTSVWWGWTAPRTGKVAITNAGSEIDTFLAVYRGTELAGLTRVAADSTGKWPALVALDVVAGTHYAIALDGKHGALGLVRVRVAYVEPPVNDNFANRIPLVGRSIEVDATNIGATAEPGEYSGGGASPAASIWWTWTAPEDCHVLLDTLGSHYDTVLRVYQGTSLAGLNLIASNLHFDAAGGGEYHIAVDGAWGKQGEGVLRLLVAQPAVRILPDADPVVAGERAVLRAEATGAGTLHYAWSLDGVEIPGSDTPQRVIPMVQGFHAGSYSVRVWNEFGTATSQASNLEVLPAPASTARLVNLSTRALCLTGDNVLIPGFVIEGSGMKRLLMRVAGPELTEFGVGNPLADPLMMLKRQVEGSRYVDVAGNDNWGESGNAQEIRDTAAAIWAFALDEDSNSAALLMDLPAGTYTIVASGKDTGTGVAIVELYDISGASTDARLVNISNRGFVGVGGEVMIPGFIVSDEGPRTFLVRAVGPTLAGAPYNISGTLADPRLNIYRRDAVTGEEKLILTNDNWGENGDATEVRDSADSVWAFALNEGSKDAAFVVTLPPGAYTVQASGVNGTTGVALVEVYLLQ